MILDLRDPPSDPPEEPTRPQLRLVPKGTRVMFRRPEDPEVPWTVRALGLLLGVVITGVALCMILLVAALLREVYETVDAQDAARAAARAAEQRQGGAIKLTLPKDRPPAKRP